MPFFHKVTKTIIVEGSPFVLDGTQYPANWLNLSSADDKKSHGLIEILETGKPEYDPATQDVHQGDLVEQDGGMVRGWLVRDLSESELENKARQAREIAKGVRSATVDAIVVTTSAGKSFDGDEVSQGRMARAILVLQATGTPETLWVLHDNTQVTVTSAELVEALALAGQEQSGLWVIP